MVCLQEENALFLLASSLPRGLQISPLDEVWHHLLIQFSLTKQNDLQP